MTAPARKSCVTQFNAKGVKAAPYRSRHRSRNARFCDVPTNVVLTVADLFNVKKKLMTIALDWPDATNCDLLSAALPSKCMRGWRITRFLGRGQFGFVFGTRENKGSKTGALKIQLKGRTSKMQNEIEAHKKFSKLGLSPTIHCHCLTARTRRSVFFVNMSRIDTTLEWWLQTKRSKQMINLFLEKLFGILEVMRKERITHGDMHLGNIGFVFKRQHTPGRIQLLDHGFASTKGALTELELVQFIRTLHRRFMPRGHRQTIDYLVQRCRVEAMIRYGIRLCKSGTSLDKRFEFLRRKLKRFKSR